MENAISVKKHLSHDGAAVRDLRRLVNTPGPTRHIVNITSVDACAIEQDGPELEQVRLLCAEH
ncbi:hypothetical protein GB927_026475 [Shinella sp. CPCC 100929]|uniref:Uncharacterized protein n=1 Tax=Shinella lacus TaxID=2654216 RepID=A0ABT1REN6_9HYPH|nr:hypothetical protein [Shinella lacus]MCQ4633612.1 hypothetical protein [Shinella lacus]